MEIKLVYAWHIIGNNESKDYITIEICYSLHNLYTLGSSINSLIVWNADEIDGEVVINIVLSLKYIIRIKIDIFEKLHPLSGILV